MANNVYLTVCDALSLIVSRRAAENIVRDALAFGGTDGDRVTAREMQDLLRGRIFARLQTIMPVPQARGEVKLLLSKLETTVRTIPPLTPEVLEGLEALRAEFAQFVHLDHVRAQNMRLGLETLSESPDPIKALNGLWAELDLLQQEQGFASVSVAQPDPSASEFEGVDLDFLETEFALDDPRASENDTVVPASAPVLGSPALGTPDLFVPALTVPDAVASAQAAPMVAVLARPSTRQLGTPEAQDRVLSRFALEEGVVGVVLTDRSGGVVQARLPSGEADQLAGVSAATAMLLGKQKPFDVFYATLTNASVFIVPLEDLLLTVLADAHVNIGRVLSEVKAIKEEL
jgi:predicted regulator of Ras-like GTPase activity (Roadblock/LC7/MglB family)